MKAWRFYGEGKIKLDELDSQPVGEDSVKIKILNSALSSTDDMIFSGKIKVDNTPLIIGRQGVGMVTEIGKNVTSFVRGDRVIVNPYSSCRACSNCKSGKTDECENMLLFGLNEDGFMRDFAVVNASDIHKIPDRVKDSDAVFLEHIGMAVNAISKLNVEKGEHIVIVGASVIGIILAQVAIYYNAVPILVDFRKDRLDIAQSLGIYYTVNSVDTDPYKKIFSLTGGRMSEAVAYMASSQMPLGRSIDYCAKLGKFAIVGWHNIDYDFKANLNAVLSRQLTLTGVAGSGKNISTAINMLANKTVNVAPLISKEVHMSEVDSVLKEEVELPGKYIKIVVKNS